MVLLLIGLGSGIVERAESQSWGAAVFFDTAVYKGFIDEEHIALELKNSPQQYSMFSVSPEVMQILSAAKFEEGKELVVQYRAGAENHALLEEINQQGIGERLLIAAGSYLGEVSYERRIVAISNSGQETEYYVDKAIFDKFRTKFSQGQNIVVYCRIDGLDKTIVAFE